MLDCGGAYFSASYITLFGGFFQHFKIISQSLQMAHVHVSTYTR